MFLARALRWMGLIVVIISQHMCVSNYLTGYLKLVVGILYVSIYYISIKLVMEEELHQKKEEKEGQR